MSIHINDSGAWVEPISIAVNDAGIWKKPSVFINDNGTWKFVWGWDDVSLFSYGNKIKSVTAQDTAPDCVFFKPDGLKMYVLGSSNDTVYQYTLTTAWDISTATYASKSVSVNAQDTSPTSIFFSPDGAEMYMVGFTTDTVYQYTLSTPWDVSTAAYASKSASVAAQTDYPTGLFFNIDGTKMYVVGFLTDTIYQYNLALVWDVSTATYASKSKSVTAQETSPTGVFFSPDGTKMYVVGFETDTVYQYTLTTAWDVSTATYASKSVSVNAQDTVPFYVFFAPNGTNMYIMGKDSDTVYQYDLTTAWDVSTTETYRVNKSKSIIAEDSYAGGVFFNPDGTKMYVLGYGNDKVYQYTLSTAWDVSTASYASKSASVAGEEIAAGGLFFNPDGTKMYVVGGTNDTVYQYTLTTAWDVSTATYASKSKSVVAEAANPEALFFSLDGTKMYVVGEVDTVYQYTLTTAWDVSTATYASKSVSVNAEAINPRDVSFNPDGTKMYVVCSSAVKVFQYTLSTAWDVSTATYDSKSKSVALEETDPRGVFFKSDGTKMYLVGFTSDKVYQYGIY